jgi:hypothetical protein
MKKINFLALSIVFVGLIALSSCKKEVRIEKNLWKKGGVWNIESQTGKQTSTIASNNFDETIFNVGTYTFYEDGSGSYKNNSELQPGAFTYSNTENKLTIVMENVSRAYEIVEWKKNNLKISYSYNFYEGAANGDSTGKYTETILLKKK